MIMMESQIEKGHKKTILKGPTGEIKELLKEFKKRLNANISYLEGEDYAEIKINGHLTVRQLVK